MYTEREVFDMFTTLVSPVTSREVNLTDIHTHNSSSMCLCLPYDKIDKIVVQRHFPDF